MQKNYHILLALAWYHPEIHRGVNAFAKENNCHVATSMTRYTQYIPNDWQGDGIITNLWSNRHLALLEKLKLPAVGIGIEHPDYPTLIPDHQLITKMVADHLIERGFKKFAFNVQRNFEYMRRFDFLNNYLVEPGSDGVVRVAGANMNYRYLKLSQTDELLRKSPKTYALKPTINAVIRKPKITPIGIFKGYSHSGKKMGIMRSIMATNANDEPIVEQILKCLTVKTQTNYQTRIKELEELSKSEQSRSEEHTSELQSP